MAAKLVISLSRKLLALIVTGSIGAFIILVGVGLYLLENRADLKLWHEPLLDEEFTSESGLASFTDYLRLEERLFAQLEDEVLDRLEAEDRSPINRYTRDSLSDPDIWPRNWNRSYLLERESPRALFVLVHGMSDSPYSLSNLARTLHESGGEVIGLRLPGHGTIPAGLLESTWQDMAAALELAVAHADERARAAGGSPVYLVGYSIGAALSVHHALAALEQGARQVDGLILLSPAIGLSPLARFAPWQARMGRLLGLRKIAWNAINLEYDPFKYGSFTINAAHQSYLVTEEIQRDVTRLAGKGSLTDLPPILAFQSAVDATVSVKAVIDSLFAKLPPGGHELVLFDINRRTEAGALLAQDPRPMIGDLLERPDLSFTLSLLTNAAADSRELIALRRGEGEAESRRLDTGLSWPPSLHSLSHVSLPFPAGDALYGDGSSDGSPGIELGLLTFRGERGVLRISAQDMLRLRWNPFYGYIERRILEFVSLAPKRNGASAADQ